MGSRIFTIWDPGSKGRMAHYEGLRAGVTGREGGAADLVV